MIVSIVRLVLWTNLYLEQAESGREFVIGKRDSQSNLTLKVGNWLTIGTLIYLPTQRTRVDYRGNAFYYRQDTALSTQSGFLFSRNQRDDKIQRQLPSPAARLSLFTCSIVDFTFESLGDGGGSCSSGANNNNSNNARWQNECDVSDQLTLGQTSSPSWNETTTCFVLFKLELCSNYQCRQKIFASLTLGLCAVCRD